MKLLQIIPVEEVKGLESVLGVWGTIVLLAIIMAYLVVKDFIKNKKDSEKSKERDSVFQYIEKGYATMESIKNYLEIATKQYSEEVTKAQALIIVEKCFILTEKRLIVYGIEIISNNNIKTRQAEIRSKVEVYTKNLFSEQGTALNEFKYNKRRLEKIMNYEHVSEVSNQIIDIILSGKEPRVLASYCENTFKGFINESKIKINEY